MNIKMSVPVGTSSVVIEAPKVKQLLMVAGFFYKIPNACGNCNSNEIIPVGHKNSGYDFYYVKCKACGHELKFGKSKEDGSLFLRDEQQWEAPYQGGGGNQDGGGNQGGGGRPQRQQRPPQQPDSGSYDEPEDDIPF